MALFILSHTIMVARCSDDCCLFFFLMKDGRALGMFPAERDSSEAYIGNNIRRMLSADGMTDPDVCRALVEAALYDTRNHWTGANRLPVMKIGDIVIAEVPSRKKAQGQPLPN